MGVVSATPRQEFTMAGLFILFIVAVAAASPLGVDSRDLSKPIGSLPS
jgi:hypothetical protein